MAKKGNKEVLQTVNKAMDIVKRIKADEEFSQKDKMDILDDFVGVSDTTNNSYWTPLEVCQFMKDLLPIDEALNEGREIHIADLSAGIGMCARPFIKKYGKLLDGVKFDLYEYNPDTSMALKKAWEDYEQVTVYPDCDTLKFDIPIEYDFVIGNPPFSGNCEYPNAQEWACDKKGKVAKSLSIMDAFVDLAIQKCKPNGYIAYVIGGGHLYKGNKTEALRKWMKKEVALKAIVPLDSDTFSEAGITGTSVGSYLIVWQKGAKQEEVFLGDLIDKKDLKTEMKSMARKFKLLNFGTYNITYESQNNIKHCKLNPKVIWTNTN